MPHPIPFLPTPQPPCRAFLVYGSRQTRGRIESRGWVPPPPPPPPPTAPPPSNPAPYQSESARPPPRPRALQDAPYSGPSGRPFRTPPYSGLPSASISYGPTASPPMAPMLHVRQTAPLSSGASQ
eukprot:319660-Pleurochrysis_carterae.AAC.1